MVQIKLSVAFVLAAAAIAPVVAQPVREGREYSGHVGHRRHHHHHPHHPHPHVEAPVPQDPSSDPNAAQPSRREYEDEFEARGLLFGQNGNLNLLNSLENQEKTLERQDGQLLRQHSTLDTENRHHEHKNHRLERDNRKLEHKHHSLEKEDKSLEHRKHHLEGQDKNLERKRKSLTAEDKSLKGKVGSLERKAKALGKKDKKLALKGKTLSHKDKALAKEGNVLTHHNEVLAQKGKALEHHNKPKIVVREYAEPNDIVERKFVLDKFKSFGKGWPKGPLHMGHGPVVPPHIQGHRLPGRPLRFDLGPQFFHKPGKPQRPHFGSSPSARIDHLPHFPSGYKLPPGAIPARFVIHSRVKSVPVDAREYTEFDDMFERDFEDIEFDAREFDDELYLD